MMYHIKYEHLRSRYIFIEGSPWGYDIGWKHVDGAANLSENGSKVYSGFSMWKKERKRTLPQSV